MNVENWLIIDNNVIIASGSEEQMTQLFNDYKTGKREHNWSGNMILAMEIARTY